MPYCPTCKSEYRPGIERCSDCDVALVDAPPDAEPAPLEEVFRADSQAAAQRICAVILDGLECFVRERGSRAFPTASMAKGLFFIAVPADQADRARDLIAEALNDGALTSEDGEPLGLEVEEVPEEPKS
jgi:hypothetical protein